MLLNELTAAVGGSDDDEAVAMTPLDILGVRIVDTTKQHAGELMRRWIDRGDRSRAVFIANAHTLNLACEDFEYRRVLNSADVVFADGTGVRLAAKLCGVRLRDNLVGTDLVPAFMNRWPGRDRYFLLGGPPGRAAAAAAGLQALLPGTQVAGDHHGFIADTDLPAVVAAINAARPDVLLVAMGNPHQERWIHRVLPSLKVPVSIGVGGLFEYWAGQLQRAPGWVRRLGIEWCHILAHQPHKWRRYLLGNPLFLARALRHALIAQRRGSAAQATRP